MPLGCYQWTVQQDIGLTQLVSPLSSPVHKVRSLPSPPPASPRTGLTIYKPLQDITAYEGDTNIQFSMVAAGDGSIDLTFALTSVPVGSSLKATKLTVQSSVVGLVGGPVSLVDSGAVVTCSVSGNVSYTATLTVLGG